MGKLKFALLCFVVGAEELLKAEYIAPVVAYLCHESCEDTGALIEVCTVCTCMCISILCVHT